MALKYTFPVRLDKFLADCGFGSRKEVIKLIKRERVKVNEQIVKNKELRLQESDIIKVDGEQIDDYHHHVWVLHKPAGYVCSNRDGLNPTIFELIDHYLKDEMQIVGRLDKDVTGLVVLTTDGEFNHRITSPKNKIPKHYIFELEDELKDEQVDSLLAGVEIEAGVEVAAEKIGKIDNRKYEMVITFGQHHVVKKMVASVSGKLVKLHRNRIGRFTLPDDLSEGAFREITPAEKEMLSEY